MAMQGISFAGIVESLRSRKDKTIAITIGSQEVDPDKAGKLFNTNGHLVYCYLSVKGAVTDNEAEIIDSVEPQVPGKRPSQRMRAILYRMWEQDNQGYTDHNLHYIHWMDKMCETLKAKLKP